MLDLFTKKELDQLAKEAQSHARLVLVLAPETRSLDSKQVHDRELLAAEIGNNAAHAMLASMSEMLPYVDEDLGRNARCAIWASEQDGVGRAGLLENAADRLKRIIHAGGEDNADGALAILERYLFALFVAVHKLRKLPAECRDEHTVTTDKIGPICTRCGERPEQ